MAEKNIELKKLTNKELKALLKLLKRKGDPVIPTKIEKILECYEQRKDRTYINISMEVAMEENGRDDSGNISGDLTAFL